MSRRTGPGRERAIDDVRTRRRGALREKLQLEFPLIYRDGRIAIQIDDRSQKYLKIETDRGLYLDLTALSADLP